MMSIHFQAGKKSAGLRRASVREIVFTHQIYVGAKRSSVEMRRDRAAEMALHDRMLGLHIQVANLPDGAEDMRLELLDRCAEVLE